MNIGLGDRVKDEISSFEGIVTARSEYLNGCVSLLVQPESLDEGKKIKGVWFDDVQLRLVKKEVIGRRTRSSGGPERSTPSRERPSG